MKYKGMVCDRCGVKITHSRVRRKRMGHIELAAPVVHPWFLSGPHRIIPTLLDIDIGSLEQILKHEVCAVISPGVAGRFGFEVGRILSFEHAIETAAEVGDSFHFATGAEAVAALLGTLDLRELSMSLRVEAKGTVDQKRLQQLHFRQWIAEAFLNRETDPQWLVLRRIPVIPPDLRPLVLLDSGNFATSDLNDLYRRIISRNDRLRKLQELNAPATII